MRRSPGSIANRAARVGQYVQQATSLLSVVPIEPYITADFKETQLAKMYAGQRVKTAVDAFPNLKLEGRIESWLQQPGHSSVFCRQKMQLETLPRSCSG